MPACDLSARVTGTGVVLNSCEPAVENEDLRAREMGKMKEAGRGQICIRDLIRIRNSVNLDCSEGSSQAIRHVKIDD